MKPFEVIDFLVSKKTFRVVYDPKRKALKTDVQLSQKELAAYYPKDSYASHKSKSTDFLSQVYLWVKNQNNKTKLRWIGRRVAKGKLLDYGAGNGSFAAAAQKRGWSVDVYEPATTTAETLAENKLNTITTLPATSTYDVITLWHVFEHLPKPEHALLTFFNALKPGGTLVLAVPNTDAWDAKHYGPFWAAYDVPRHLWHYNKESILHLTKQAGFLPIQIMNMFWDVYYIALLSEKHSNSFAPWIKAIFKGTYSNLVGWNKKNSSALTFFLQKPK